MNPSEDCWVVLEQNLRQDGTFRKNRLFAEMFQDRYEYGMGSVLRNEEGEIVACAFLWETGLPGLVELGTVWVHPDYRRHARNPKVLPSLDGKAPSKAIFEECQAIIANNGLRAIMLTCKESVGRIGREAGWTEDGAGDCQVVRYLLNLINNILDDSVNDKSSPTVSCFSKMIFRSW